MSYTGRNPTFIKMNLTPLSADPPNPVEGDLQFSDGTARTKGLWQYKDGAWAQTVDVSIFELFLSSNFTFTTFFADQYAQCDATSASFSVTLPNATLNSGRKVEIKKIDSTTNTITVNTGFGQSIDGLSTYLLQNQYDAVSILSNGTNWVILNKINKVNSVQVQTFSSSGSFNVPIGKTTLQVNVSGGGGGGGAGAISAGAGGGGGGGAGIVPLFTNLNVISGETLTITIGVGGTGGSGISGSPGTGNSGATGGNTTISGSSSGLLLTIPGAGGGTGGTAGSGGGTGGGGGLGSPYGGIYTTGGNGGTNVISAVSGSANIYQATAGTGGTATAHGAGGGGGAGFGVGGNGGNGSSGAGVTGGIGAGGGGGGANSSGGPTSGAGGNGGDGFVTIYY